MSIPFDEVVLESIERPIPSHIVRKSIAGSSISASIADARFLAGDEFFELRVDPH